jgi:uncharacterized membrane protein YccF (DUF307 family)
MKTIGNVLWFVLAGVWLALGYASAALVCFITIIGIPFGIQAPKRAWSVLWPFGRDVVRSPDGGGLFDTIGNVIWLVLVGWWLFLAHLVAGVLLCITIIGIPFGVQAFKLSVLSLWPFGREIVELGDG